MRPSWDVVWLSDIPWTSLWQRPQQLATRFPDDARILFVEPWTLGHRPAMSSARVTDQIQRVSFPFLPLHARSHRLRRIAYRLGDRRAPVRVLSALQRARARSLRGFFRRGSKRLLLVENFMGYPTIDAWRPDRVVYDMIDAPFHFAPIPPRLVPYWEGLLRRADRVVVTSRTLQELARRGGAGNPTLVGNGVDARRFERDAATPALLPGTPGSPVLGYAGSIHAWFDMPLIACLAGALPHCRVVLVGPAHPDLAREIARVAAGATNLHWIGPRPYDEIPGIVGAFTVGLIPFRRTPLTEAVNPVKLYEYAAAGVPTLTTRFSDEVDGWAEAARIAESGEAFVAAARDLVAAPADRAALRAFAARHDWEAIGDRFVAVALEDAA